MISYETDLRLIQPNLPGKGQGMVGVWKLQFLNLSGRGAWGSVEIQPEKIANSL
jgi:hypothetical protein